MFPSRGVLCVYVSLSLGYAYILFVCLVSKPTFSELGKYVSFFVFLPAPCPWPDLRTLREGRSDAHLSLSPLSPFFILRRLWSVQNSGQATIQVSIEYSYPVGSKTTQLSCTELLSCTTRTLTCSYIDYCKPPGPIVYVFASFGPATLSS